MTTVEKSTIPQATPIKIDWEELAERAIVYSLPMKTPFRGITTREGMLFEGDFGWGEFCPFPEYDDQECIPWLASAVEAAFVGWPDPIRDEIEINSTIPAVSPENAQRIASQAGCKTAKIKVSGFAVVRDKEHIDILKHDVARVAAVRAVLGTSGRIRIDANGTWTPSQAITAISALDEAAEGLEYVEQPCRTVAQLAEVRQKINVKIAADESIRRAQDPLIVALANAADIAVIKCAPLGGVRNALEVATTTSLPCVISSALETSVGISAGLALAGALPALDLACGLGTSAMFEFDVVAQTLAPTDGYLSVPRKPLVPDSTQLRRAATHDQTRTRWWKERLRRVGSLCVRQAQSDPCLHEYH